MACDVVGNDFDGVLVLRRSVCGFSSLSLWRRLLWLRVSLALRNYLLVVATEMLADVIVDLGRAGVGRPDLGENQTFEVLILPTKVIDEV